MDIAKVILATENGALRLVIPKKVREKTSIKAGDCMIVTNKKDTLIFKKIEDKS
jgi:AbrB family looped-hinge helix DNA binding protein